MNFVINTKRLVLRPLVVEDAPALQLIANQPYVLRWLPDWQFNLAQMQKLIRYFSTCSAPASKERTRIMLAVTCAQELLGLVGIGNKEEVDNEIEITYYIGEQYAGQGYMTEAVQALAKWSFCTLGLAYLVAIVQVDNFPSQRVVEKCGFQKLATRMILDAGQTEEKPFYYYRLYRTD